MAQITKDNAYDAVAPDDFPAMLEVERYGKRSTAFDKIISATHDHFWDPLDKKYIDFTGPFDLKTQQILPNDFFPIFYDQAGREPVAREADQFREPIGALVAVLDPARRAGRARAVGFALPHPERSRRAGIRRQPDARRSPSRDGLRRLHQGALGHAASLRPDAADALDRDRLAPEVYKKIIGMQMLVEGLAMGAFATLYQKSQRSAAGEALPARDDGRSVPPQIRKDLGRPHDPETVGGRTQPRRRLGRACFQTLLFNLVNPEQMKSVYAEVGIDWQEAMAAIHGSLHRRRTAASG